MRALRYWITSARLPFNRHLFCSARPVILYDLGVKGYHTPLTREQIAELFYAGRVDRHHPCKPTTKSEWRTIDELFPLLKYDCAIHYTPSIEDSRRLPVWTLFAAQREKF